MVERLVRNEKARGSNPLTSMSAVRRLETSPGMRTQFEREAQIERSEINPLTSMSAVRRPISFTLKACVIGHSPSRFEDHRAILPGCL